MNLRLYTLAIGHTDFPTAEIFISERAALERRLELSEVSAAQGERLLGLFENGEREQYEKELNQLESQVSLVCSIEPHEFGLTSA